MVEPTGIEQILVGYGSPWECKKRGTAVSILTKGSRATAFSTTAPEAL